MSKYIITINRQYGSGGREVGRRLAEELRIPFYDKELISLAAKESGFTEAVFENADEKPSNSLLYSIVTGSYSPASWLMGTNEILTNDTLYGIQADVIRKIAAESCVIVGRCADFTLRDNPDLFTVFTHAPLEARCAVAIHENPNFNSREAENFVRKMDKTRANYYSYYANRPWDIALNYDLVINTDSLGVEGAVTLIKNALNLRSAVK